MNDEERAAARAALKAVLLRVQLARLLGFSPRRLQYVLYRLPSTKRYTEFTIKKRRGGDRVISAPIKPIKDAQRTIARYLDAFYTPRACVYGYVEDRNIKQNAACHEKKRWVLRVDLENFFPSVHLGRVRGMLLKEPFALTPAVATTIAQIACHKGTLPQGSPASPIITNLICRGLDAALRKLARSHRCTYTRYCDDLVFSTNRRVFPVGLAFTEVVDGKLVTTVGDVLARIINAAGFGINAEKVQLRGQSHRQMVTGLVTNARINVPRKFVRDLRMIIHVWRKFGYDAAENWYLTRHDKRTRPPEKRAPKLRQIVIGKLQYLGYIRGWNDPLYRELGARLERLPQSNFTLRPIGAPQEVKEPIVLDLYVEGPTDRMHIQNALRIYKARGEFQDLHVNFVDYQRPCASELFKRISLLCERPQLSPCIGIFDADELDLLPKITAGGDLKQWSDDVFSFAIPKPAHRPDIERWCIELLYTDAVLRMSDSDGRRLYLASEFRQTGAHITEKIFWKHPKKGAVGPLIVEEDVFAYDDDKSLCISKMGFARLIEKQPDGALDLAAFRPILEMLVRICGLLR